MLLRKRKSAVITTKDITRFVLRLAGGQLLFMDSLGVKIVLEMLLKHDPVNPHKGVQRKGAVESVSGVFQVICLSEAQLADFKFQRYLFNFLHIKLLNFTEIQLTSTLISSKYQ